jgi:hypothetical protein
MVRMSCIPGGTWMRPSGGIIMATSKNVVSHRWKQRRPRK